MLYISYQNKLFMKRFVGILFSLFIFFSLIFFSVKSALAVGSGPVNPFTFNAFSGTKPGTVTISWYHDGSVHTYDLFYGTDPGKLSYGVIDLDHKPGPSNQFTVEGLTPGGTYFFKLSGISDGAYLESGPILAIATPNNVQATNAVYFSNSKNYQMPYLFAINYGKKSGSVDVTWFSNDTADRYDLVYGTQPNEYIYGVQNMSSMQNLSNTFTVSSLSVGKTYYFALVAEKNNNVLLWTKPLGITVR